jgi:hypothetical protein
MGINVAGTNLDGSGSVMDYSVDSRAGSQGGGRGDDLSLAYSIDDNRSRASTYISASSEDDFARSYYHPALPTPAENPAPPPPPPEPEQPTAFESFIASPIDYIFGGNDDDVSTLGGFNESFRWDGDASTIASTPTLTQEFRQQKLQPTIYEDSGDEESSSRSRGADGASVHFSNEEDDQYTYGEVEEASMSQGGEGDDDLYNPSKGGGGRYLSESGSDQEEASVGTYESSGEQSHAPKSLHSAYSSRGGGSMTDEDASRGRFSDDVSLSLSAIAEQMPKRRPPQEEWSQADSASLHSSQSEVWRRNIASNKSWKVTKSEVHRRPSGLADSRSVYSMGNRSAYSLGGSLMPERAEVVTPGTHGGPMMTVGMSGRAVVHVKLNHATDGTIESLAYTTPLIDGQTVDSRGDYTENFNDEDTVTAGSNDRVPWYDYYHARSKLIRRCHTRQCYRLNVMALVGLVLVLTVVISISTIISADESGGGSTPRNTGGTSAASLNDLAPPSKIAGVTLPSVLDSNLENWFSIDGDNSAHKDDVPYYFHIPLAGAMIAHESWAHCLGFTIASAGGKAAISNTTLKSTLVKGASFVNVDVTVPAGIEHAAKMGLVPSGLPDVIISPLFGDVVTNLYGPSHKNKFMMTMRHPVDRAVALFEFKKSATSDPNYDPSLNDMTIEEFALSGLIESNYVVRLLTGKFSGSLTSDDLNFCKELLRRKAVVGIYEQLEASLTHFERYFGWTPVATDALNCQAKVVEDGVAVESVVQLDAGSSAYALIKQQNIFDLALYGYMRNVLVPFQIEVIERQAQSMLGGGGNIIS